MKRIFFIKTIWIVCGLAVLSALAFIFYMLNTSKPGEKVDVWVSTPDLGMKLERQAEGLTFSKVGKEELPTIFVGDTTEYQKIDGIGASMTDSSAWLIHHKLSTENRNSVMKKLFSRSEGIGLSLLRQPIGASDFALQSYTYDDMASGSDDKLDHFSTAYDDDYMIPLLKQALQLNPQLMMMSSPWSPPAWMKSSGSVVGGMLNYKSYDAYARYFVRYIQEYKIKGIPIHAVSIQNEPHVMTNYPSMYMSSSDQVDFIKNHLGPAFKANGIDTKILAWDHNFDEPNYVEEVYNDAEAKKYIDGSAWHCYAGQPGVMNDIHYKYPDKSIYFTECSGGEWTSDEQFKLDFLDGITYFRNWAQSYMRWNLALDENHGPLNGGCDNCNGLITVRQQDRTVAYNDTYYAIGHFSKFIVPGARRIASTGQVEGIYNVAFKNADDSKVLVVYNENMKAKKFRVQWGKQSYTYVLAAGAGATFTWKGEQPGSTVIPAKATTFMAISYNEMYGVEVADAKDAGKVISNAGNNDYIMFKQVNFGSGLRKVEVRLSSNQSDGIIEFHVGSPDGELIGTVSVPDTGRNTWETVTTKLTGTTDIKDVYLVFKGRGSVAKLQSIRFTDK